MIYFISSGPSTGHEHAKGLVDSIKAKKSMDELLALVDRIPISASDDDNMSYNQGMYSSIHQARIF